MRARRITIDLRSDGSAVIRNGRQQKTIRNAAISWERGIFRLESLRGFPYNFPTGEFTFKLTGTEQIRKQK